MRNCVFLVISVLLVSCGNKILSESHDNCCALKLRNAQDIPFGIVLPSLSFPNERLYGVFETDTTPIIFKHCNTNKEEIEQDFLTVARTLELQNNLNQQLQYEYMKLYVLDELENQIDSLEYVFMSKIDWVEAAEESSFIRFISQDLNQFYCKKAENPRKQP